MNELLLRLPDTLLAVGIALIVAYLPGLAILNRFQAIRRIDGLSRLLIAPGVSAALYVVLFAICYKLGLGLGWWLPWLIGLISLGSLLYPLPPLPRFQWTLDTLGYLTLGAVAIALLGSRLYAIYGLVAPMWGDSVHHTIIVQLMLENGGLFHSWQPYADATTFTYHFGFHALTTMYAWMRGISAEFAVLMMGQIANFCAVMALYALVRLWTKNVWGGVFAVVVGGFVSTYPAYFVYWGRYTQLTGHVILVAALVLLATYLRQPHRRDNVAYLIVLPLLIAGVGMAQYKVAILFVAFAIPLVIAHSIIWYRRHGDLRYALKASLGRASILAGIALLIFMTRGVDVLRGTLGTGVGKVISTELGPTTVASNQQAPLLIRLAQSGFDSNSILIWSVVFIGVCVILIKRRDALWFILGAGLCLVVMNPRIVGINRAGLVDEFHVSLSVYIVAATIAGLAIGTLLGAMARYSQLVNLLAATGCLALTWIGVSHPVPFPAGSVFVLPDDVQMMQWIKDNVPSNEKIAAPGFVAFQSFSVGRDAGWWIPFYAEHRTNLMFMAAGQEEPNAKRALRSELTFTKALYSLDMSLPSSAQWLIDQGYQYFYIGAKPLTWKEADGTADHAGLINQLLRNPSLKLVHQSGEARLLEVMH